MLKFFVVIAIIVFIGGIARWLYDLWERKTKSLEFRPYLFQRGRFTFDAIDCGAFWWFDIIPYMRFYINCSIDKQTKDLVLMFGWLRWQVDLQWEMKK